MAKQLKKIESQVILITGATSGIGLTTARRFSAMGASIPEVNSAGVSIYGRHQDVPLADQERLSQTNF